MPTTVRMKQHRRRSPLSKKGYRRNQRDEDRRNASSSWVQRFAAFGDSGISLLVSFSLLLLAVVVHYRINTTDTSNPFSTYESLGPIPMMHPPMIHSVVLSNEDDSALLTTETIRQEFIRDGVICIRGLIDDELLERLDAESAILVDGNRRRRRKGSQFHTEEHSPIFARMIAGVSTNKERNSSAFMDVALGSNVAKVAAELLLAEKANHSESDLLRVVRDIFLAKDDEQFVCGWHTDDLGFWPATPESPGINAWIALDDMDNVEETGGFALAVQSHRAPWKEAAQIATVASSVNFPPDGFASAQDMLDRRTGLGTCNLQQAAPHINERMEEISRIYPVRRGDVVFHTRWLFHRTVAVGNPKNDGGNNDKVRRRYSVRYGFGGETFVPPGFGTELSVLSLPENGGRTLNEVDTHDGPWYPQAWPRLSEESHRQFLSDFQSLRNNKLSIATERRKARVKELKEESRKRHRTQRRNYR